MGLMRETAVEGYGVELRLVLYIDCMYCVYCLYCISL
jgi:hypothetical protein